MTACAQSSFPFASHFSREVVARFDGGRITGCYLPLYIFTGEHPMCARLRSSNIDASAGALEEIQRIAKQLRRVWPAVEIVLRADSGFCRDAIMSWCEQNRVGYVFGPAKNERLLKKVRKPMKQAQRQWKQTAWPAPGWPKRNARRSGCGC
jgi:hypothetical protein